MSIYSNTFQRNIENLMVAMEQHIPEYPTLDGYPFELRCKLILEEALEFIESCGYSLLIPTAMGPIPLSKLFADGKGLHFEKTGEPNWPEMVDGLTDLLVVTIGSFVSMGLTFDPFWEEVHKSNMAKLGPDGKVLKRSDGKFLKPEGWQPPNIIGVLRKEILKASLETVNATVSRIAGATLLPEVEEEARHHLEILLNNIKPIPPPGGRPGPA